MDDPIENWTGRLLQLAPGLGREAARDFVHRLYYAAQDDETAAQTEADFERDE